MAEYIFNWIKRIYKIDENADISILLSNIDYQSDKYLWLFGLLSGVAIVSLIIWFLTKIILIKIVEVFASKSKTKLDDYLVDKGFFSSLAHLFPLLLLDVFFKVAFFSFPNILEYALRLNDLLLVVVVYIAINRFLSAFRDLLKEKPALQGKPIDAFIQIIKIVFAIFFIILMLSVLTKQSPLYFITSLGAMTAILLLVFKDTILGFVGSIQLAVNDMIRINDWITMEKYGADGDVIEINLTTVKIQNFDKTITTVPTYSFITDSFKNWRGMAESDGRRMKRSVSFQIESVNFATPKLIDKLSKVKLLKDFIIQRQNEITEFNKENNLDEGQLNARKQTNLGLFRRYLEYYLKNHDGINKEMSLMVRQLPSSDNGVPLELYCFTKTKEWAPYESVVADIFDHIFAVVKEFELEIFEKPSGLDIREAINSLQNK